MTGALLTMSAFPALAQTSTGSTTTGATMQSQEGTVTYNDTQVKVSFIEFNDRAKDDAQKVSNLPGDTIRYSIYIQNVGNQDLINFPVSMEMKDFLPFGEITDPSDGALSGTVFAFPGVIQAKNSTSEDIRQFDFKLKSSICQDKASDVKDGKLELKLAFNTVESKIMIDCGAGAAATVSNANMNTADIDEVVPVYTATGVDEVVTLPAAPEEDTTAFEAAGAKPEKVPASGAETPILLGLAFAGAVAWRNRRQLAEMMGR